MFANWQNKLKDYVTETDDIMIDLRKNLQMYNAHRDRVSGAYRERMDEINRELNFNISLSQNLFVCAYSSIFIKLIIFKKYKRFNPYIKFSLLSLFCLTLEPLTLASSYIASSVYVRSDSFQKAYSNLFNPNSTPTPTPTPTSAE